MSTSRTSVSPLSSSPPGDVNAETIGFDDDTPSVSGMRSPLRTVALLAADATLRSQLAVLMQSVGLVPVGDDALPSAVAIISDAPRGSARAVAELRAIARSDAAIIIVLAAKAPPSEMHIAYETGALLCVRQPVDEDHLLSAIGSAIDLRSAKAHADDLMRQLDVQAHLASLGRVTANFTHELTNPLAVLVANFEVVREQFDGLSHLRDLMARALRDDPSRDAAEAEAAGRLLAKMTSGEELRAAVTDAGSAIDRIRGILTMVRQLARGNRSSRMEEVDLASVVRDVRRWAADQLEGVEVQELIDEPVAARADRQLLGQIVLNLVTNAAHAVKQLPSPRLRLHVYRSKETAVVSVRDNGPGIAPEIRDRIFEPFFTTRRGQGGTGLGLALCREYAAQMQGHLTLWTVPGRGACFRVHLGCAMP